MLNALQIVTIVVVGVMVGVEFSVAFVINPILNALPDDSGQLGRSHGGRMLAGLHLTTPGAAGGVSRCAVTACGRGRRCRQAGGTRR
jgi:hypothetical protein